MIISIMFLKICVIMYSQYLINIIAFLPIVKIEYKNIKYRFIKRIKNNNLVVDVKNIVY